MIYILITAMYDGTYFQEAFNDEKDAIIVYKKEKSHTFEGKSFYRSVQLFEFASDPQDKGVYPIYKPIKKYNGTSWIKTKFYKKFIFDFKF